VTGATNTGHGGNGLVVAVDGGGAKTDLALLDRTGSVLSLARSGASHVHYLGIEGSVAVIEAMLGEALTRAGLDPVDRPFASTAQILLAGADLPEERSALNARFERLRWSERLMVDNDTIALLRTGTERGWGVAVVCGAGINCLGRAPQGREVRFASLGEISGDWGGGGDVGLAAVAAAARAAEGRGPRTVLETAVPRYFGLTDPLEVSIALHTRQISRARLGELAPVVLAAYDQDAIASAIIRRLAGEVSSFARAALRRLELREDDPDVVLGGRLLRALPPPLIDTLAGDVRELAPRARIVVTSSEPIVGAALLGLDAIAATESASIRARSELDAAMRRLQSTANVEKHAGAAFGAPRSG
jgi:N-acetylglucosamine kinase-like BadF-type ATPase